MFNIKKKQRGVRGLGRKVKSTVNQSAKPLEYSTVK